MRARKSHSIQRLPFPPDREVDFCTRLLQCTSQLLLAIRDASQAAKSGRTPCCALPVPAWRRTERLPELVGPLESGPRMIVNQVNQLGRINLLHRSDLLGAACRGANEKHDSNKQNKRQQTTTTTILVRPIGPRSGPACFRRHLPPPPLGRLGARAGCQWGSGAPVGVGRAQAAGNR